MKKLLSATLLVILSATTVYGQPDTKKNNLKFGVKAKPHFAYLCFHNMVGHRAFFPSTFKFSAGLFGEHTFSDMLGGQIALEYSGKGTKDPEAENSYCIISLDYIMLAVMPRFYMGEDRRFCLFIGPQISWLTAAKGQKYKASGEKDGDIIDYLKEKHKELCGKKIVFGMLLGLDYEFDNGILLGYEQNIGLTGINKSESEKGVSQKIYTYSAGVTLGYNFAKLF